MSRHAVELSLAQLAALADEIRAAVREALRDELPRALADVARPAAKEDGLLGVAEAARRIGLSKSTTYKLAERCEPPSVQLGTRVLFRPADLAAYAEARRRSPERVREMAAAAQRADARRDESA